RLAGHRQLRPAGSGPAKLWKGCSMVRAMTRTRPKKTKTVSSKPRRIICGTPNANSQLASLFSSDSEIISPRQRKLTQAVFGQALTPVQVVERVCRDVQRSGLPSVLRYTELFDKVKLTPTTIRVPLEELKEAHGHADPELLDTVRRVRMNIISFQSGLLHSD